MTEHEKLVEIIVSTDLGRSSGRLMDAYNIADNLIANDIRPVVRARWLYDSGSGRYFCSTCLEYAISFKKDTLYDGELYEVCLTDYCCECGAKMDLGD